MCTHLKCHDEAILKKTHNIPYVKKITKKISLLCLLTEHVYMVPKVFEPLKFDCFCKIILYSSLLDEKKVCSCFYNLCQTKIFNMNVLLYQI